MVSRQLLQLLLTVLGRAMALASCFVPRFRRQVTAPRTIVVASGDGAAASFHFDPQARTMRFQSGEADRYDCALRYRGSGDAIRALLHPRAAGRIVTDVQQGRAALEGNALLLLWFHGLTRVVAPIGRPLGPRQAPPVKPQRHDSDAPYAGRITVEPALAALPAEQEAHWRARAKLIQIRVPAGEPAPKG